MSTKENNGLLATDPKKVEPAKPKILIFGAPGVGKTWFSLNGFPAPYYIDTEGGATREHYTDRLSAANGAYLGVDRGSNDFRTVIDQFKKLATVQHPYKTVVVDSISKLFITDIALEAERLGDKDAFQQSRKRAIGFMRQLFHATQRLDMNVIFIAHEKAEWGVDSNGQRSEIGKCADVWDKLIYDLDLTMQAQKRGNSRVAIVKKSRLRGFPGGDSFPLTFEEFATRYGKDVIEKASAPIVLAGAEQVAEIARLVELLKIPADTIDKWLEKANAETMADFTADQAGKVISSLTEKLKTK